MIVEGRRALSWQDVVLPAVVGAIATSEAVVLDPPDLLLAVALQLAACALLVLRRRWTLITCTAAGLMTVSMSYVGPRIDELASPILIIALATFAVARYLPDLRGLPSVVAIGVAALGAMGRGAEDNDITDVVFLCALLAPPFAFGLVMRALSHRNQRLQEQTEQLLALQAQVRHDAVVAERGRIARELHDVIAHSVSAMVVQASAAEELAHSDPDRAARASREAADTGRRALAETGRLLHLIRDDADELGLSPDLGLDRLDELVDGFRRNGLNVDLHIDGSLTDLPAGVDLSGYRIVQEALTNALKHASDSAARLGIRRGPAALLIDVENRGRPAPPRAGGLGLVGMAERVQVFGGQLTHGLTSDGHFVLSACLPLTTGES